MTTHEHQSFEVPEAVRQKAEALGAPGREWLESLPELLAGLERDWGLHLGRMLPGGSAAYVAEVTAGDGTPAVLKVHLPGWDSLADEIRVLRLAGGRGYARLLHEDETRGAMLLERLGPRLSELGYPVARQIEVICATLREAWAAPLEDARFQSGAWKARWLQDFIVKTWEEQHRPCSERVIEQAVAFCRARAAAFDPARSVLVHGDAHASNTLAVLNPDRSLTGQFKLVDPDGLIAERACDLAALMRDWHGELLAGDPLRLGRERCALLSRLTGEDEAAIWQWGLMERVSTGLLLIQVHSVREGQGFLQVAEAWV